jgi:hypothetical protein
MQGLPIAWHSAATIFTLRSAPRRDFSFCLKGIGSYRTARDARVAELVDAHDSKSCSARSGGSIPSTGTSKKRLEAIAVMTVLQANE